MKRALILIAFCAQLFAEWPIDSVLSRADSCVAISWIPSVINTDQAWYSFNGNKCTGVDEKYKKCDFIPGVQYRGIAYSYGGEDTPIQFEQKLAQGLAVGSHLCHYTTFGDPSSVVAGTDCSGFLCWTWNVPRVSTTVMVQKYPIVEKTKIQAGDALVKSGNHCVLVAEVNSLQNAVIIESTSAVNSCRERVVNLTDPYWSSYVPVRNPAISPLGITKKSSHWSQSPRVLGSVLFMPHSEESSTITLFSTNGTIQFQQIVPAKTETVTLPDHIAKGVYVLNVVSISQAFSFQVIVP